MDWGSGVEQVAAARECPMPLSGKWEWKVLLDGNVLLRLTAVPCLIRGVLGSFR